MSTDSLAALLVGLVVVSAAAGLGGATAADRVASNDEQWIDQPVRHDRPADTLQVDGADQFEPNDDFNSSTAIEPGEYSNLSITAGDVDVYGVSLESGEALSATISFDNDTGDLDMALVGPDRDQPLDSSEGTTDTESVSTFAGQNGTYYLVVYGYNNSTAAYDLSVDVEAGGSATGDAFEPNDDIGNATALEDGTYENLSVGEDDIDVYAVSLDRAEVLTASIRFDNDVGDLDLALFAGEPPEIVAGSATLNDTESVSYVSPSQGTYYLVVYGFGNATGPYDLSLTTASGETDGNASSGDELEPNDDLANATAIRDGFTGEAAITPGDIDVYAVSLDAGDALSASIAFSHAEGDLEMGLVGPDGTVVQLSSSVTDNESVSSVAPQQGTYYLVVYGFDNATGPYDLSVTVATGNGSSGAGDQFEPNDDLATATVLEPGNYTDLRIDTGDVDVFTVDATAGEVLTASIAFSHAEGDLDMVVFGPNETTLARSQSITDDESITTVIPETGTYTVVVYGYANATGAYDLRVAFSPPSTGTEANGSTATETGEEAELGPLAIDH